MPHLNSSSSTSSNTKATATSPDRVEIGDYSLKESQAVSLAGDLRHETLIIQSSSTPIWGGSFLIDIKEKNIIVNNISLSLTTGAVVGTSLVGSFSPSFFFFTKIDIIQNGNIIDVVYPNENFIRNQLLNGDPDRLQINNSAGNYASSTQRGLLSSTTTSNNFIIYLSTYLDQVKSALLTDSHNIRLRVYLDTLSNVYNVTSGTLTSAAISVS